MLARAIIVGSKNYIFHSFTVILKAKKNVKEIIYDIIVEF